MILRFQGSLQSPSLGPEREKLRSGPVASNIGQGAGECSWSWRPCPQPSWGQFLTCRLSLPRLPQTLAGWVATLWLEAERRLGGEMPWALEAAAGRNKTDPRALGQHWSRGAESPPRAQPVTTPAQYLAAHGQEGVE